ncbi:IS110 family transposase [Chloroflexota bacterium]
MFYFGIDWSENHHNLCIQSELGATISELELKHTLRGFEQLDLERCKLGVPSADCLVAIETSHNLLVDYLLDRDYVVYLIPPQATDGYRTRRRSSGARTDETDAAVLAKALRTDRDCHRRLRPNSTLTQQILAQVRLSEVLRRSIQRESNQLRAVLLRIYPQALGLFGTLTAQINLHFLMTYPTAEEALALSESEFEAFCRNHRYCRAGLISQRYAHLMAPAPEANPAAVQAYRDQVRILAELLLPQVRRRLEAHALLTQLFSQHPDAFIFESLPGTGELLAPALLAKFGDHRDRFSTASSVQALAGTCPVTVASGRRRIVKFRRGCDKEFRRIAQQFARASIRQSGWALAYWRDVRPHCASNSDAYRRLANRWLAIIWKMWQDRKPYDETYHLRQRAQRRRPRA